jgi:hypothetical protein
MSRPLVMWVSGITAAAALYAELDRRFDGWTFSEHLRPWAKEHPALFATGCVAAPIWFWRHIYKK